jgi:hypothetical protein
MRKCNPNDMCKHNPSKFKQTRFRKTHRTIRRILNLNNWYTPFNREFDYPRNNNRTCGGSTKLTDWINCDTMIGEKSCLKQLKNKWRQDGSFRWQLKNYKRRNDIYLICVFFFIEQREICVPPFLWDSIYFLLFTEFGRK